MYSPAPPPWGVYTLFEEALRVNVRLALNSSELAGKTSFLCAEGRVIWAPASWKMKEHFSVLSLSPHCSGKHPSLEKGRNLPKTHNKSVENQEARGDLKSDQIVRV